MQDASKMHGILHEIEEIERSTYAVLLLEMIAARCVYCLMPILIASVTIRCHWSSLPIVAAIRPDCWDQVDIRRQVD